MRVVDSIASPGSSLSGGMKTGTGDDRYVFDEAAGWACAIDGATDVGPVRIFREEESDAAWYAEMFAGELLSTPIGASETPQAYFPRLATRLRERSEAASRVALSDAPLSSLPTAAAIWLRAREGRLEGVSLGDAMGIVGFPDGGVELVGDAGKPDDENARAKEVMKLTEAERRKWLQDTRELHNRPDGYWVFGVQPEAANHLDHKSLPCPPGTRALIMTDGFYRLVAPYDAYSDAELLATANEKGLGFLLEELRGMESSPADDAAIGRFKTSDDATALLLEF